MRRAGIIFILLGIVIAILAGFTLFLLFPRQTQPVPEPTVEIVVAFQNIPEHTEIGIDQVGKANWPQHIPTPSGAFASPDDAVGKVAQVPIYPGQAIVEQMVVDKEVAKARGSNASLILEPGTLAIAIPVNTTSNVAEAVQPGDHVDIIVSFEVQPLQPGGTTSKEAEKVKVTHILLQDVVVLQVGTWPRPVVAVSAAKSTNPVGSIAPVGGTQSQPPTSSGQQQSNPAPVVLTVQVKAQDADVLKYIQWNASDFSLALRPANDHALASPTPVTIEYLQERFGFQLSGLGR